MAEVGLNAAARQFAVPRTTLLRASRDGRLSSTMREGRRLFDTAEVAQWVANRPPPVVRTPRTPGSAPVPASEVNHLRAEVERQRLEVDRLRAELAEVRAELRAERDHARTERERLVGIVGTVTQRLLTGPASLAEAILPSWITGRS